MHGLPAQKFRRKAPEQWGVGDEFGKEFDQEENRIGVTKAWPPVVLQSGPESDSEPEM
jgi:hypothetical protein